MRLQTWIMMVGLVAILTGCSQTDTSSQSYQKIPPLNPLHKKKALKAH